MAAQDLTQVETFKAWLPISISNTNDDATIARLITAVSLDFQRATLRPDLLKASYTEVRTGDGGRRMIAYHWPVTAVSLLKIAGATIPESADKMAAGWYLDSDIDPERVWNIYLIGSAFLDGAPVQLTYSAGYVQPGETVGAGDIALPEDIEQAVIDWCAYRYKERPNVSTTQRRSVQGESAQTELLDAPPNVLQVIERYKRQLPCLDRRAEEREERVARSGARRPAAKR